MPTDISVVIVNHNAGDYLVSCVTSACVAARQIIVVDNASTDGSLEALEATPREFPGLEIIRNCQNLGFAHACNVGIARAEEQWLLLLNPDAVLQEGAADYLLEAMRARPDVGMAGPRILNPDGSDQNDSRREIPTTRKALGRALGVGPLAPLARRFFPDYSQHDAPLPTAPEAVEAVSGACLLVRRAAMEDVGLLDESYFLHCEDLDWCMRFGQAGWTILFVPDALVEHDKGGCSRSRPIFVEWHKHRGMLLFYRKFFRDDDALPLRWLVYAGVAARFSAAAAFRLLTRLTARGHG